MPTLRSFVQPSGSLKSCFEFMRDGCFTAMPLSGAAKVIGRFFHLSLLAIKPPIR